MKTEKTKRILISLLFFLTINEINTFKCGADKLKIKPKHLNSTKEIEKRRLDQEYTPIKIGIDFTPFEKPSSLSNQDYQKVKNLITETMDEFKKFLYIEHEDINLDSNDIKDIMSGCEVDKVSRDYRNFLINNDLIVFPYFDNSLGSGILAAAGACITIGNNRPRSVFGILLINPELSFNIDNTDLYMKNLLLHEVTHILVFNPDLFKQLGMVNDSGTQIISSKALLKARQHFNCDSLSGIPLENQGGEGSVGSHWEARYMLGDYMISTDYIDYALSDITLALFEDTGYYKVNYYSGGLFKYGKNKGCDFINEKCIKNGEPISEEFCTSSGQKMCSSSMTMKAYCAIYDYTHSSVNVPTSYQYFDNPNYGGFLPANFCPVANAQNDEDNYYPNSCKVGTSDLDTDYGETIGDTSFCFISSLLPRDSKLNVTEQAICYEIQCDDYNKKIIIYIGSLTITCPTSGGIVNDPNGFKGSINCPKYIDICDSKDNNLCNEMFDCLSKGVETDYDSYIFDSEEENFNRIKDSGNNNNIYSISSFIKIDVIIIFFFMLLTVFL